MKSTITNESLYQQPSGAVSQNYYLLIIIVFVFVLGILKSSALYIQSFLQMIQRSRKCERSTKRINELYHAIENCNSTDVICSKAEDLDIDLYNALMGHLVKKRRFREVYDLFKALNDPSSSLTPNQESYEICVKALCSAVKSGECINPKMLEEVCRDMLVKGIPWKDSLLSRSVGGFIAMRRPDLAWEFFYMLKEQVSAVNYMKVLRKISQTLLTLERAPTFINDFFESCLELLRTDAPEEGDLISLLVEICGMFCDTYTLDRLLVVLEKTGKRPSLATYGKMIAIYGTQQMKQKVLTLGRKLESWDLHPNEKTYGCLMESYLKCNLLDEVDRTYQKILKDSSISCNVIIYTTLIRAYARQRQFNKVLELYDKIKKDKNFQLNLIAYNSLLDCCVACNQFYKVQEIFADMVQLNPPIEPDLITYSTLIKAMCKADCMDKAMELYNEMVIKGITLDCILYNSLLDGFVKTRKQLDGYQRLINDMKRLKIRCNNYTYSILIKLYAKQRDLQKVLATYAEMKRYKIRPTLIVYTCLLQACIKNKQPNKAMDIFVEMRAEGVEPDVVAYNTIVNGCLFSGRLLHACKILNETINRKLLLANDTYENCLKNLLINRSMKLEQKKNYARIVCGWIEKKGIRVNKGYYKEVCNKILSKRKGLEQPKALT